MRIASEQYVTWYATLTTGHQREIAFLVSWMMPNHPLAGDNHFDTLPENFVAWIRESSKDKFKAVGTALALVKLTEFVFIRQRGTHEDWDVMWDQMSKLADSVRASGESRMAEEIESMLLNVPETAAAWIATAETWQRVRASTLSDDALYSCLRS